MGQDVSQLLLVLFILYAHRICQANLFFGHLNVCPHFDSTPIQEQNHSSFNLAFAQSFGFFDDISNQNWKLMQQRARHRINHRFKSPSSFTMNQLDGT
jgi:hypothetical protein